MSGDRRVMSAAVAVGIILVALCLTCAEGNTLRRFLREAKETKSTPKPSFCHRYTPCGWSVYTPYTKEIDYYMPNTCVCKDGLDCIRTENDISISAYVHMCRAKTETTERIFER